MNTLVTLIFCTGVVLGILGCGVCLASLLLTICVASYKALIRFNAKPMTFRDVLNIMGVVIVGLVIVVGV
jgi:hypothetical protein